MKIDQYFWIEQSVETGTHVTTIKHLNDIEPSSLDDVQSILSNRTVTLYTNTLIEYLLIKCSNNVNTLIEYLLIKCSNNVTKHNGNNGKFLKAY